MSEPPGLFKVEGFWPFTSASQEELGKPPITAAGYIDHCESWARYVLQQHGIDKPADFGALEAALQRVPKESIVSIALALLHRADLARRQIRILQNYAWEAHSTARDGGYTGTADQMDLSLSSCGLNLALMFADLAHFLAAIETEMGPKGEGGVLKPAQANKKSRVGASRGGKESGVTRVKYAAEQAAKWKPHVTALAKAGRAEQPGIPQDRLAWYVDQHWDQQQGGDKKSTKATTAFISELERAGIIPRKST